VIAMPSPPEPMEPLVNTPDHNPADDCSDRRLTPGEALAQFFLDKATHGRNAANDDLVHELTERIRALADPPDQP
jgi:hypothetical protein